MKETTPIITYLLGKNEEKIKKLTGDPDFGSTVKNAYVKGVQAQANNQTMLANNTSKNVRNVAQHHGAANAAYSSAYEQHARNVGGFAKSTADHWAGVNAHNSQLQQQNSLALQNRREQRMQEYGPMWAMTLGITGSDQTGASIWGYRNDTRMEEPRSDWDVAARKEHRALERTNPTDARNFAVGVNEGLNRAERERKAKALQDWVSESGANGAAAWGGGRALNQMSPLDSYNKILERAAIGVNRENPELTATDIKEIIDDTNAGNIEDRFGKLGGLAYRGATWIADSKISEKLLGQELITVGKKSVTADDILTAMEVGGVIKKVVTGSKEWFEEKKDDIEQLTENYRSKGMKDSKARYKATRDLLEESYRREHSGNR